MRPVACSLSCDFNPDFVPQQYLLHIYTPDGRLLTTFEPYADIAPTTTASASTGSTSGKGKSKFVERKERSTDGWVGLGIRTVRWHPSGDWIAVGGWDGKVSRSSTRGMSGKLLTRVSSADSHPEPPELGTRGRAEPPCQARGAGGTVAGACGVDGAHEGKVDRGV